MSQARVYQFSSFRYSPFDYNLPIAVLLSMKREKFIRPQFLLENAANLPKLQLAPPYLQTQSIPES